MTDDPLRVAADDVKMHHGFAWGYFAAIVLGTIIIIAIICTIATLVPKPAAKFSLRTGTSQSAPARA